MSVLFDYKYNLNIGGVGESLNKEVFAEHLFFNDIDFDIEDHEVNSNGADIVIHTDRGLLMGEVLNHGITSTCSPSRARSVVENTSKADYPFVIVSFPSVIQGMPKEIFEQSDIYIIYLYKQIVPWDIHEFLYGDYLKHTIKEDDRAKQLVMNRIGFALRDMGFLDPLVLDYSKCSNRKCTFRSLFKILFRFKVELRRVIEEFEVILRSLIRSKPRGLDLSKSNTRFNFIRSYSLRSNRGERYE